MDDDKRTALEERRRFMQQGNKARALRAGIEPAWTALEQAGENFRVYRFGDEPEWCPEWMPQGYSSIPWDHLSGVQRSADDLSTPNVANVLRELLATRLAASDRFMIVPDGSDWSLEMPREAFDRHAEAIVEAVRPLAYFVAPPAQWLIQLDWDEVFWKDG